jgi:hypothetical protein
MSGERNYGDPNSYQQLTARSQIEPTGSDAQTTDGISADGKDSRGTCLQYQLLAAVGIEDRELGNRRGRTAAWGTRDGLARAGLTVEVFGSYNIRYPLTLSSLPDILQYKGRALDLCMQALMPKCCLKDSCWADGYVHSCEA